MYSKMYSLRILNSCRKFRNRNFYQQLHTKNPKLEIEISKTGTTKFIPSAAATTAETEIEQLSTSKDAFLKTESIAGIPSIPELIIEKEKESIAQIQLDEVPGPKALQNIAKVCSFIPLIGNLLTSNTIQYMLTSRSILGSQLSWGNNGFLFRWLLNEYGPIVRLQGPFGGNVIILSRPEDALSVFSSEGKYPIRSNLDCIEKYRLKYRQYKHAGPFLMSGMDWEKLRKHITESLHSSTHYQFKGIDVASNDFVMNLNKIKNRQDEVPVTFRDDICNWAFESLCAVLFGRRFSLKGNIDDSIQFINAFHDASKAIQRCESGLHLWKFFETSSWKSLVSNCDIIDKYLVKYIKEAEESMKLKKEKKTFDKEKMTFIEAMLLHEEMHPDDILTVFLDMMLIGVNAVTHSMSFLLYHLARNPKAQRILTEEINTVPRVLTFEDVSKLKYLKACIKESLRLKPPIPVLSRILTKDTVISNYNIPKGTVILMATYLSSTREEHFEDALKFIPERWLHIDSSTLETSVACIPFGYGPKACLAKNLAEMQLSILLIKILRRYKIQYHYGDIKSVTKLLAHPDKPLRFRFISH